MLYFSSTVFLTVRLVFDRFESLYANFLYTFCTFFASILFLQVLEITMAADEAAIVAVADPTC